MQFAVVAVLVLALEVIDTVGHVTGLLNLCHETTGTDGMDATGGNEEHIAIAHLVAGQRLRDGVVLHHLLILSRGNLLLQTTV